MRRKLRVSLMALGALGMLALVPVPAGASATTVSVVASGFDNPRGVAFYRGRLLVGEAGHGGPACAGPLPTCLGLSGQISSVNLRNGSHTALVSNLISVDLGPEGTIGVSDVSVNDGRILSVIGAAPQAVGGFPCSTDECRAIINTATDQLGQLISVSRNGSWRAIAAVGAKDFAYTTTLPAPNEHDANPYGVLAVKGGGAYVADAGANTLDFVNKRGQISIVQHFFLSTPTSFPTDAVPTCVAQANGSLWVADLSGRLFRIHGSTATQVPLSLIHHVTGCSADAEGNLYLVDMWGTPGLPSPFTGSVVKYSTDEGSTSVVAAGLNFPNMITIGPEGALYVSANSVCRAAGIPGLCPNGGTVLRITTDQEGDNHNN
jgi:sugar lactone lactonase YvrE